MNISPPPPIIELATALCIVFTMALDTSVHIYFELLYKINTITEYQALQIQIQYQIYSTI